jgi:hypothetical protein
MNAIISCNLQQHERLGNHHPARSLKGRGETHHQQQSRLAILDDLSSSLRDCSTFRP